MSRVEYYKLEDRGGTRFSSGTYWSYAKVVYHEFFGEETCQTFSFKTPHPDHHFIIGDDFFQGFGFLETDKYSYYCDLGKPITKKEFNDALKEFMKKLNDYTDKFFENENKKTN